MEEKYCGNCGQLKSACVCPVDGDTNYDIFISHASQDANIAQGLCSALEATGLHCFIAPRDVPAGHIYSGVIVRAVKASRLVVLLVTPRANESDHVMREINAAADAHRLIIPVRVENVQLRDELSYFISVNHWLEAMPSPAEQHFGKIVTQIQRTLKNNSSPAPPSLPTGNSEVGAATSPTLTPTRKPKTSIQQPDKSKQRAIFLTRHVEDIAKQLEKHKQRATYQAVAGVAGIRPQRVGRCLRVLGGRCPRHSWIVNLSTGEPIGYSDSQKDRDLRINPHVISSSEELSEWLKEHS